MHPFPDLDIEPWDPAVLVSMWGDHVVICPPRRLDVESTEILIDAAALAVETGSTVMIDLDPTTPSGELIPLGLPTGSRTDVRSDAGPVTVLGPGVVRLRTRDSYWTIDLTHSRMVRTDAAVDPSFVTSDRWTQVRAIWASCAMVRALTVDGSYLTTRTAWTASHDSDVGRRHRALRPARR